MGVISKFSFQLGLSIKGLACTRPCDTTRRCCSRTHQEAISLLTANVLVVLALVMILKTEVRETAPKIQQDVLV